MGQVGSAQRGHQLWAQGDAHPRAVPQGVPALQTRTGAPVAQEHCARRAHAAEAARDVAALVGTGAGALQALVDV